MIEAGIYDNISLKYCWNVSTAAAKAGEPKPWVIREKFVSERCTFGSRGPGILWRWWWPMDDEEDADEPLPCRTLLPLFGQVPVEATFTGDRSCLRISLNSLVNCLKKSVPFLETRSKEKGGLTWPLKPCSFVCWFRSDPNGVERRNPRWFSRENHFHKPFENRSLIDWPRLERRRVERRGKQWEN